MRGYDECHFGVGVEPGHIYVFVGFPGAAGDEAAFGRGGESGKTGNVDGGAHHISHAVEAGVAGHGDVLHADYAQQSARALILHVEPVEAVEHLAEHTAAFAEEALTGAEDR